MINGSLVQLPFTKLNWLTPLFALMMAFLLLYGRVSQKKEGKEIFSKRPLTINSYQLGVIALGKEGKFPFFFLES
jgi:uncharacterized protein (DUF697 family)